MTFCAGFVVDLLFGGSFAEAANIIVIHVWSSVFVFLGVASGKWVVAEGRSELALQRTLCGLGANIGLNMLLIPKYGGLGAAYATLAAQMTSAFLFDICQSCSRDIFFMKLKSLNPAGAIMRLSG